MFPSLGAVPPGRSWPSPSSCAWRLCCGQQRPLGTHSDQAQDLSGQSSGTQASASWAQRPLFLGEAALAVRAAWIIVPGLEQLAPDPCQAQGRFLPTFSPALLVLPQTPRSAERPLHYLL